MFSQSISEMRIPATWILLDNQSTVDVFCNKSLLKNVHQTNQWMSIHCNAGVQWTNQRGTLPGYGVVWYAPRAIANILSLANVSLRYRVIYDSEGGDAFRVIKTEKSARVFRRSKAGLYFSDTAAPEHQTGVLMVNTVKQNKTKYTNVEVTRAEAARKLQTSIGRPSTRDLIHIVNNHLLPDCPVTKRDIMAAEDIFGPDGGVTNFYTAPYLLISVAAVPSPSLGQASRV